MYQFIINKIYSLHYSAKIQKIFNSFQKNLQFSVRKSSNLPRKISDSYCNNHIFTTAKTQQPLDNPSAMVRRWWLFAPSWWVVGQADGIPICGFFCFAVLGMKKEHILYREDMLRKLDIASLSNQNHFTCWVVSNLNKIGASLQHIVTN